MKRFLLFLLALALSVTGTYAGKKKKDSEGPDYKILQTDARSVTVALGKAGDEQATFNITDATEVTVDGRPSNARELIAGMMAHIETTADRKTATAIHAHDPPTHPAKHRAG
jgi:hypothetical protein